MKLDKISVNEALEKAETLLKEEQGISNALRTTLTLLIALVRIFLGRFNTNSQNSSKPPASDQTRRRGSNRKKSGKKPGGQKGHEGYRLEKTETPDHIEVLTIDKRTLSRDHYRDVGYEARQVIDIEISRVVTEYRAQILEDSQGNRYVAHFPDFVKVEVQYGYRVKAQGVYLSQYQLLPYARIQDYFAEQMAIALSSGSLFNFNREAYELLEPFDAIAKRKLIEEAVLHADETGINVNKKRLWLHTATSVLWTYFYPHEKRGREAMDEIGILPNFSGTLCHDHWKPYYIYSCLHSLCNAHHLRELEYAHEEDKQQWALEMKELLLEIKEEVEKMAAQKLSKEADLHYREKYRSIIHRGDGECPAPIPPPGRKRVKKSKSRNLLERFKNFENDVLRFMEDPLVPFTNNPGENDLRMAKVQQKISGCFRSIEGAYIFCRIRSYLLTCQKHNVTMTEALELLFQGRFPDFLANELAKNH